MAREAKARIKINKLLEESGWRFFDYEKSKANISLEVNTKLTEQALNEFGDDFEKTKNGFIDFLLLDEKSFPLAVLEAKSEEKSPLDGKEQARKYAESLNVRFVILSNGSLHYFWDIETGNPYIVTSIPTCTSLVHRHSFKPKPESLANEPIDTDYIVITQKPDYKNDPRWHDEKDRDDFIKENNLRFLREYQLRAVKALQSAVKEGKDRFLFEMATGTGKTLVAAAIIKLFLRTGNANRALFLVDRLELEDQARKNMVRYLKNDFKCVIYKENREDWIKAEIVITTVQSLLFKNKYRDLFSPTDFDLVISDEAHRSIGGNSRAVFEYFTGYKLGLTATPKDYLKNVDESRLSERDQRKLERRQLLDTYRTFGCESGDPTFRYSLLEGVQDGYLVNPIVVDARTEVTTQLLSNEGYSVLLEDENGELKEKIFFQKDFEKTLFSDKTNQTIARIIIEKALWDPLTDEVGKTIMFCVSQNHASKMAQILNEIAHKYFPGRYKSDFAVQVTSNIHDSKKMTLNFANNNLNGHTAFKEGYISSKTRVCVTVGMMTTGYDCEDLLNVCLVRPVFSPTDFIQMKGRGTRKYTFTYREKNESGAIEEYKKEKENYKLFDFFANCEYFEEKFNYDEVIKLPQEKTADGTSEVAGVVADDYENVSPDPIKTITIIPIGAEGMKIDRKFFEKFEDVVKADDFVKGKIYEGKYDEAEAYIKSEVFDKPEEFFNLEKLCKSVRLDRRLSLREILDKIFDKIKRFKTKGELLDEEVQKFISIYHPETKFIHIIGEFMKAYILDANIRKTMDSQEYSELATNPRFNMSDLKELDRWRAPVIEYVKNYVSLNSFV